MITISLILALIALAFLVGRIASQTWAPLWISVLFLIIIELLRSLALGK